VTRRLFLRLRRQLCEFKSCELFVAECSALENRAEAGQEEHIVIEASSMLERQAQVSSIEGFNRDNAAYLRDVSQGRAIGLLVYSSGEPVHYGFVLLKNRTACLLGLPRKAALLANSYTVPQYRGNGCQGRSVATRAIAAMAAGYSTVYAETCPDNLSSQRGLARAGMKHLGRCRMLRLMRFFVIRLSRPPGVRFFGICW